MDKKDNYKSDLNSDEKKDDAPFRFNETTKATSDYGAARPRMNTIFRKDADAQFKEGNGSEDTADEED